MSRQHIDPDGQLAQELQEVHVHTGHNNHNTSSDNNKSTTTTTTKIITEAFSPKPSTTSPTTTTTAAYYHQHNHSNIGINEYDDDDDDDDDEDGIGFTYNDDEIHATLLNSGHERESLGIENLDVFFSQVYKYYLAKGFWTLTLQRILKLCTVLFMIGFSTFLFVVADWRAMWKCENQNCANVSVVRRGAWSDRWNWFHRTAITFELGILCYWIFLCVTYVSELISMWRIKHFFNVHLEVSEKEIQTLEWDEIVDKIIHLQDRRKIYVMKNLNAFDIMNRIMRRENFLIAFINKEVLNLRVPLHYFVPAWKNKYGILTQSLMWNLKYIINYMFDSDFKVKEEIIHNPNKLRKQFIWLGILNLIASPFIFFFVVVYTVFKYSVEIRKSPLTLLDRRWSLLARWKFREFNELPHIFERRMKKSYKPAHKYTEQFPDYLLSTLAKSVMFIVSALAATIILISSVKNPLLLYFNILNQNLFWWLTVLLLVWAYAKSLVIDERKVFEPKEKLQDVCSIIHYYPENWKELGHHTEVREEFNQLFQYSLAQLFQELLSILVTPIILCISLPNSAEKIIEFMDKITVDVEGIGHVCGFATFNFNRFGSSVMDTASPDHLQRSLQNKMEVSYLNFKAHYPGWVPPVDHGSYQFEQKLAASISQHSAPDVVEHIKPAIRLTETVNVEAQETKAHSQSSVTEDETVHVLDDVPDVSQMAPPSSMLESKDYFYMLDSFSRARP